MPSERGKRNIHRLRNILEIAANRGFGYFIARIGFDRYMPGGLRKKRHSQMMPKDIGVNLRVLLEDLGPTFVKLGQLLSVRPDITPPHILSELEKLQDTVPPYPFSDVKLIVQEELKKPIDQVFESFSETPIASASIGQVHEAYLFDGTKVAVKVQRPNIIESIEADLDLLQFIATQLRNRVQFIDPLMVMNEFRRSLENELDYTKEAMNADRFQENFANDPNIKIPRVYWDLTTKRVLTAEFIDGIKVSDLEKAKAEGVDYKYLACKGAEAFMKQVLVDGFFHGDLHPGNILLMQDRRIAYLDFGIVGEITAEDREKITLLAMAITKQDSEEIITRLKEMGIVITPEVLDTLKSDLREALRKYYGKPLEELKMANIGREFLHVVYRNHIQIPKSYSLLVKAMVTIEGVASLLCPDINVFDIAKPYVEKLVRKYYLKQVTQIDVIDHVRHTLNLVLRGPELTEKILDRLSQGEMIIKTQQIGAEKQAQESIKAQNRVVVSILAAAVLIGSSIIYGLGSSYIASIIGFVIFVCILIFLSIMIRKSGGMS